jgi:hypothetical protein
MIIRIPKMIRTQSAVRLNDFDHTISPSYITIEKHIDEIRKYIDKIIEKTEASCREYGRMPDFVLINEDWYCFIKEYMDLSRSSLVYRGYFRLQIMTSCGSLEIKKGITNVPVLGFDS